VATVVYEVIQQAESPRRALSSAAGRQAKACPTMPDWDFVHSKIAEIPGACVTLRAGCR